MAEIERRPRPVGPNATPNIIRRELQARTDLFVAGEITREMLVPGPYAVEHVMFFVGPTKPVLTLEELNQLMKNMFRQIRPDRITEAYISTLTTNLHTGDLYFSEGLYVRATEVFVYPNRGLVRRMFIRRQEIGKRPIKARDFVEENQIFDGLIRKMQEIPRSRLKGFK